MNQATNQNDPRGRASRRYRFTRRGDPFRHGFAFTLGGGAYIAVCLFVGLAAANSGINLLFLVFGLVLGGLMVSGVLSTLTLTRLRITRQMPALSPAGRIVLISYQVANRKRWLASYSLHVREYRPPAGCSETYLPAVSAAAVATQRGMVLCTRRGLYRFDALTAYTRFPFSLFVHFARFKAPGDLLVYPAVGRLTRDAVSLVLRNRGATCQPQPRFGGEEEFYGLREYRHGDNPRWIHWRRSARLGVLVVREMSPPVPRRLVVLISARRAPAPPGEARPARKRGRSAEPPDEPLEKALALAASLIHDSVRQSFEVGLVIASRPEPARDGARGEFRWYPATRGRQHWLDMMRALALFTGRRDEPLHRLPRQCLRHLAGATCLWITRGLPQEEIDREVATLATWNVAVQPLPAERTDFDRLMVLPRPDEHLAARIPAPPP